MKKIGTGAAWETVNFPKQSVPVLSFLFSIPHHSEALYTFPTQRLSKSSSEGSLNLKDFYLGTFYYLNSFWEASEAISYHLLPSEEFHHLTKTW